MSVMAVPEDLAPTQQAGTFRFTPEEEAEMVEIIAETEEADQAGKLIPIEEVLAKLGRSS